MKSFLRNKKGFSLIELIVVMAVMAVLVLLATPKYIGYTKDADVTAMQADAKVLSNAALQYNIKNKDWPLSGDALISSDAIFTDNDELIDLLMDLIEVSTGETFAEAGASKLEHTLNAKTLADYIDELKLTPFDESKLSSYVKSTENPIGEYYLATGGLFEGEVFHKTGFENSAGEYCNGVYILSN